MTRRSPEIKPRVAHLDGQRQASSSCFRGSSGLLDFGGDPEPSSAGSRPKTPLIARARSCPPGIGEHRPAIGCDTANGKLVGEEGIDGPAEAFLLAGAKSVVGALWEVEDSATGSLMKAFYSHLAQGQDKAFALRQAKLDYLQSSANRSPVYWAPFTLVGDGSAPIVF